MEATISDVAEDIANDLGLQMDKSIRLEWYKVANTRTRCMRITQVSSLSGHPNLRNNTQLIVPAWGMVACLSA